MPIPSHVALKQRMALQTQIKNAAISGDMNLMQKLNEELKALNKKIAGNK